MVECQADRVNLQLGKGSGRRFEIRKWRIKQVGTVTSLPVHAWKDDDEQQREPGQR